MAAVAAQACDLDHVLPCMVAAHGTRRVARYLCLVVAIVSLVLVSNKNGGCCRSEDRTGEFATSHHVDDPSDVGQPIRTLSSAPAPCWNAHPAVLRDDLSSNIKTQPSPRAFDRTMATSGENGPVAVPTTSRTELEALIARTTISASTLPDKPIVGKNDDRHYRYVRTFV